MKPYEDLQDGLQQSLRAMTARHRKVNQILGNISSVLQSKFGFPTSSIAFKKTRQNENESEDTEPKPIPDDKVLRLENGHFAVTLVLGVHSPSPTDDRSKPIVLGDGSSAGQCFTFVHLQLSFPNSSNTSIGLTVEGGEGDSLTLHGLADIDKIAIEQFCNLLVSRVQVTIKWVATGEGNPERRMGFHA